MRSHPARGPPDRPSPRRPPALGARSPQPWAPACSSPLPTAGHAAGNSLVLPGGGEWVELGANAALFIDGSITFNDHCTADGEGGVDDFVYPATDVYIVPPARRRRRRAEGRGGGSPNTIVGTGSGAFLGELIAAVYPSGKLGDGEYDIVYDTCQDGKVSESDEIFSDAIVVDVARRRDPAGGPVDPAAQGEGPPGVRRLASDAHRHDRAVRPGGRQGARGLHPRGRTPTAWPRSSSACGPGRPVLRRGRRLPGPGARRWSRTGPRTTARSGRTRRPAVRPVHDGRAEERHRAAVRRLAGAGRVRRDRPSRSPTRVPSRTRCCTRSSATRARRPRATPSGRSSRLARCVTCRPRSTSTSATDDSVADLRGALAGKPSVARPEARRRPRRHQPDPHQWLHRRRAAGAANRGLSKADDRRAEDAFVGPRPGAPADDRRPARPARRRARRPAVACGTRCRSRRRAGTTWSTDLEDRAEHGAPEADAGGPYTTADGAVTLDGRGSTPSQRAAFVRLRLGPRRRRRVRRRAPARPRTCRSRPSRTVGLRVTDDNGYQGVDPARVVVTGGDRAPVVSRAPTRRRAGRPSPSARRDVLGHRVRPRRRPARLPVDHRRRRRRRTTGTLRLRPDRLRRRYPPGSPSTVTGARRRPAAPGSCRSCGPTPTRTAGPSRPTATTPRRRAPGRPRAPRQRRRRRLRRRQPDAPAGGSPGRLWTWGIAVGTGQGTFTNQYSPRPVDARPAGAGDREHPRRRGTPSSRTAGQGVGPELRRLGR